MAQYDTQYTTLPEQPQPPRKLWPLAAVMVIDVVVIVIAILILTILISTIVIGFRIAQQGITPFRPGELGEDQVLRLLGAGGVFVILLVQNAIFVAVPMLRVALLRREPLAEIGFQAHRPLYLALFGLGLGVLVLTGNATLGYLFSKAGIEQNQAAQYPLFQGDYVGQALFFIGAAVLAPIGEEVLFRGYLFNAIRQTFQAQRWGVLLAYLVSALGFMVAHLLSATQGLIGLLIPTFLMGLILAWGMHRTGSLLPGIIAHAINNSVALSALLVCINYPGVTDCPKL